MIQALEITNEQDIKAIHSVVSPDLKVQIEQAYPHLFVKQFDFTGYEFGNGLPFFVGRGLCSDKKDVNKCLLVHSTYEVEVDETYAGHTIIRFFEK